MLDSYGVSNMGIKKKLAYYLFEKKCLSNAKAFRVTSSRELKNLRKFGIKQPIAVIPHGINSFSSLKKDNEKNFIKNYSLLEESIL